MTMTTNHLKADAPRKMPDDVYRAELGRAIDALETWRADCERFAAIETRDAGDHWWIKSEPYLAEACAFEIVIQADQLFSLDIAGERYQQKPATDLSFFVEIAKAISAGHVDQIVTLDAMTGQKTAIASRIRLSDSQTWIGERRLTKGGENTIKRIKAFLPYRRAIA